MDDERKCIGDYIIDRDLGQGTTSKVKLGIHRYTGQRVAIKIIKRSGFETKPNLYAKVQREIALMRLVSHPHLLKLIDVLESPRHLYIALEFAQNGELFQHLVQNRCFSEPEAMRFFRQIIFGIEYLHSFGICHRDLKPENILLDEGFNIKIADFGFAKFSKSDIALTSCGSPHYASPEVIRGTPYDGRKADVWSCGVILYALLAGYLPFDDPNIRTLLNKVKVGRFSFPSHFSPATRELIKGILDINPATRMTIDKIKEHPAFRGDVSLSYVFPTPLPIPSFVDPVPLEDVSEDIAEILSKIGYEESLAEELGSRGFSMAKVFYYMLTRTIELGNLNWDNSITSGGLGAPDESEFFYNDNPSSYSVIGPGSLNPRSQEAYSLVNRPDWAVSEASSVYHEAAELIFESLDPIEVMYFIQYQLNKWRFQWFHPDDYTIIARQPDTGMTAIISCVPSYEEEIMNIVLTHYSGPVEAFTSLHREIGDAIDNMNSNDDIDE